jgi:hypothetical protein
MPRFIVHPIAPDIEVRIVRAMPPLPDWLERRIDALWSAAATRVDAGGAGPLFNGRVFCAETITPHLITGHMTEYRRLVAQMEDNTLFDALRIRSLAACGVVRCADGVLVGRRPAAAIYQPGLWQLPPAGSVDAGAMRPDGTMDVRGQLLTELREEIGLTAADVSVPHPLCLVEHDGSHVSDLGMAVSTPQRGAAVLAAHRARGNGEYDPLLVVPFNDIAGFVERAGDALVPPAREFLCRAGLLDRGLA